MTEIPRFQSNCSADDVGNALREAGCAVLEGLAPAEQMDEFSRELDPHFEAAESLGPFLGLKTKRNARLIAKSSVARELVVHPLVIASVENLFKGHCYNFRINITNGIRIFPGETLQSLHRDDGYYPFKSPGAPTQCHCIWALTDFTAENGASHAVLGSHLWPEGRKAKREETVQATMAKGSVFIYRSGLIHGGGANNTDKPRTGAQLGYSLGWLRQEENQYLAVPPELAKTFSKQVQDLLGYRNHGYLGWFEGRKPEVVLHDEVPEHFGAEELYDEFEDTPIIRR